MTIVLFQISRKGLTIQHIICPECLSNANQPIQGQTLETNFLIGFSYSGTLFTCPNHAGSGSKQLQTTPQPQTLLKLFKLANPRTV